MEEPRVVEERGKLLGMQGASQRSTVRLCFQALTVWNGRGDARGQWSQGSGGGRPGNREEDCDHRGLIVGPELEIMVRIYWLTD